MTKIAILSSHNGSGFDTILEAQKSGELKIEIVLVLSNNTNANVIKKAETNKINTKVINSKTAQYPDEEIEETLRNSQAEYIFLSGYMKKISQKITQNFTIINCHPSLLPKHGGVGMYGRYVHESVIKSSDKISGVTIHKVNEEFDKGEILLQKELKVEENETIQSLEIRIKELEKLAIVEALKSCLK